LGELCALPDEAANNAGQKRLFSHADKQRVQGEKVRLFDLVTVSNLSTLVILTSINLKTKSENSNFEKIQIILWLLLLFVAYRNFTAYKIQAQTVRWLN
jgi:uncharacterized membrane protein